MTQSTSFELQLEALFQAYADAAPIDVDAPQLATTIAAKHSRGPLAGSWFSSQGLTVKLLLAGLLLALVGAAVAVGARLLIEVPPPPAPYSEVFEPVGQLLKERESPIMAELADGRVLITGSLGDDVGAEIFDLTSGTSTLVPGASPPTGTRGSAIRPRRRRPDDHLRLEPNVVARLCV
jgi:hypothetical protein